MGIFSCSELGTATRSRLKPMIVLFNSCKYILREDEHADKIVRTGYDDSESEGTWPEANR